MSDFRCFGCGEVDLPGCPEGFCAKGSLRYEAYDDPQGQTEMDRAFGPVRHVYERLQETSQILRPRFEMSPDTPTRVEE